MKHYPSMLFFLYIFCISCNGGKHVVSSAVSAKKEFSESYPLFFTAENSRVLGESKKAILLYEDYVQKYPDNPTALYNLARLQLQKMSFANAEKNAARATSLDPANRYFRELYTQMLIINKKVKLAENQYDILIQQYPQNKEYLYEKALLYIDLREYDKAILTLNELEKVMGFNEDIIVQKKNIYLKQSKTELAVLEIEKLRQEDRSSPKYDIIIADIYESAKQEDKVRSTYLNIEKKYSEDPMAQVALAQYYMQKNDAERYNHFMQQVMKNKNLDVETKIALVIPALQKMETDTVHREEIIQMAKSIAEESQDNKDALSLYADVLYFSRKYDDALKAYNRYLLIDQQKFSIWSQVISIYFERQQTDSVINFSKRCIANFPENAIPYFYAGVTFLQKKETETAIDFLSKGVVLEKQNKLLQSQFYSSLADAYHTQKNYSFSDSCFEKAIQLQPSDASALNNYAYYLSLRKEKLEYARKMSKKSLELQPGSKSFLDTYGWILFQQGNYKEALIYIQKAIDAEGETDGTLMEHLGDVYFKLGNKERAREHWRKAKEKGENNPVLQKKIKDGNYYEQE